MRTSAFGTARVALGASCVLAALALGALLSKPVPIIGAAEQRRGAASPPVRASARPGADSQGSPQKSVAAAPAVAARDQSRPAVRREVPVVTAALPSQSPRTTPQRPIDKAALVELGPIVEAESAPTAADEQGRPPPRVTFRWVEPPPHRSTPTADSSTVRLAASLTSLQQQVERLTELHSERQAQEAERTTRLLAEMRQIAQLQSLEERVRQLQNKAESAAEKAAAVQAAPPPPAPAPAPTADTPPPNTPILKAQPTSGDEERFSLQIQDAEMAQVLDMLGQMTGRNIVAGRDVTGKVSANLKDVSLDQALAAVLRSGGYVYERENDFIFVMTPAEAEARKQLTRKLITKVYRPHYISVKDLQALVTPLLTETIGKIAVTAPAEIGITPNAEVAGGDQLAQRDALLVQDYAEVIEEIDGVLLEMDVPPLQVVIEATILSVTLTDEMQFGVNFALLGGNNKSLFVSGNGQTLNNSSGFPGTSDSILPPAAEFLADTAGLKYGFISGDISAFIKALEEISDTNLVARPQLQVINKQKAELIIGNRLSYKTLAFNGTQTVENVNFLDSGTKLILRPFIAPDGLIRMEVHPERSSAVIDPTTQLPNQSTTEVTTNIMVRDGATAVIGGLISEEIVETQQRVPYLGALPVVGNVFKNKTERIDRTELIVLITPRIVVEPQASAEGETARIEFERRADFFRDHLSPVNRQNLARMEYERALYFFERDELTRAHVHVREALRLDKNDLDALRLKDTIEAALRDRSRRWLKNPLPLRQSGGGETPQEMTNAESDPQPRPSRVAAQAR